MLKVIPSSLKYNETYSDFVEPFEIDDGSLGRLTPEYAMALGVEWQLFRQRSKAKATLKTLCVGLGEIHKSSFDDRQTGSTEWSEVRVGDLISSTQPRGGNAGQPAV